MGSRAGNQPAPFPDPGSSASGATDPGRDRKRAARFPSAAAGSGKTLCHPSLVIGA